jgi:hypothetical protein
MTTSPPLFPLNPAIIAASERPMANWYRQFPGSLPVFPLGTAQRCEAPPLRVAAGAWMEFVIDLDPNEER